MKFVSIWIVALIILLNENLKGFSFFYIDVITIEKTSEHFRLIYDAKGRFAIHRIKTDEAKVSIFTHEGTIYEDLKLKRICFVYYSIILYFYSWIE